MSKRYDNNVILIYGDCHFPFHDSRTFDFLNQLNNYYKPDRVIDLGDTSDSYSFSRYPKDPRSLSIPDELKGLRKAVRTLGQIFPRVDILQSNHCERLYSKATVAGLPREVIKPYREIIEAPEGWRWYKDLTLTVDKTRRKIYFCHERGSSVLQLAKNLAMNTVMGHVHSKMSIEYFANPLKEMFAVQNGCMISDEGPPYSYNKANIFRPIKGATIIIDGKPELIRL